MKTIILTAALSVLAASAFAQVSVKDSWVRATVPHQTATGVFMQITAHKEARLVAVQSPIAAIVEMHEMSLSNNVMKMRAIPDINLPAGKAVDLKPGGLHIMLQGLKQQAKDGDSVPLTLVVETADKKRESISLQVPVRPLTTAATHSHASR